MRLTKAQQDLILRRVLTELMKSNKKVSKKDFNFDVMTKKRLYKSLDTEQKNIYDRVKAYIDDLKKAKNAVKYYNGTTRDVIDMYAPYSLDRFLSNPTDIKEYYNDCGQYYISTGINTTNYDMSNTIENTIEKCTKALDGILINQYIKDQKIIIPTAKLLDKISDYIIAATINCKNVSDLVTSILSSIRNDKD